MIPSTIHAVIAGRIDRLEEEVKHLLQEAAVIGRTVPYEILRRITRHAPTLEGYLEQLEDLDLLRRSPQLERQYVFKHTLIQEVVYSGLLKKDRQVLHRHIGLAMEQVFADRLPEFYETLAFHFRHSDLSSKAVDYLRKSGGKSLRKYAVQESHQYYQRAFQILRKTLGDSEEEKRLIIDFLNEWALVFYYRADFKGFTKLFREHRELAESLPDKALRGIFYGWLGITLFCTGRAKEAYQYSLQALELGRETGSYAAIGLAYADLTWACAELKLLEQGLEYGKEVLARSGELEPMAFILSVGGLGMIHLFKGESEKDFELGQILLEYGKQRSDLRSTVVGYICMSYGYFADGDFARASEWCRKALELSNDPLFSVWPKLALANYCAQTAQFQEAGEILREIIPFCQHLGMDYIVSWAQALHGVVLVANGQISRGMKILEAGCRGLTDNGRWYSRYLLEICWAEIYFQMATRAQRLSLWASLKNLGFFLKELPQARRKAAAHLEQIIQTGREVGARGFFHGKALLNLGLLHRLKGQPDQARECLETAEQIFTQCQCEPHRQQACRALAEMG